MPQMSPCSWLNLIVITNIMMINIKMNLFFEKKF